MAQLVKTAVTEADEGDIEGVHEDTCGYIVSQGKQGVNESFDWVLAVYYPRLASRFLFPTLLSSIISQTSCDGICWAVVRYIIWPTPDFYIIAKADVL